MAVNIFAIGLFIVSALCLTGSFLILGEKESAAFTLMITAGVMFIMFVVTLLMILAGDIP